MRPRLTYANVVATLALVLAIGGGTVYAAIHLGKNSVRSKNIAAGAVKSSDLGKDAVTGAKVRNGAIATDDLAASVIAKLQADVSGSATAGPTGGVNTNIASPLPLSGTTTFTPRAGDVSAIAAGGTFLDRDHRPHRVLPARCVPTPQRQADQDLRGPGGRRELNDPRQGLRS